LRFGSGDQGGRGAGINLPGLSLQPSEFVKADLHDSSPPGCSPKQKQKRPDFPRQFDLDRACSSCWWLDAGPSSPISAWRGGPWRWCGSRQFFMAGLAASTGVAVGTLVGVGAGGVGAYIYGCRIVTSRINRFFDPGRRATATRVQSLDRSVLPMAGCGGPRARAKGTVKDVLPDGPHADFRFLRRRRPREFGPCRMACLIVGVCSRSIVLRGFSRLLQERQICSCCSPRPGLLIQFGPARRSINMASSLHLIPTQGAMTICRFCPMAARRCWPWALGHGA